MTSYSALLDLGSVLATPCICPGCSAASLVAVPNGEYTHFACSSCGDSWQLSLGRASLIAHDVPPTRGGAGPVTLCVSD